MIGLFDILFAKITIYNGTFQSTYLKIRSYNGRDATGWEPASHVFSDLGSKSAVSCISLHHELQPVPSIAFGLGPGLV
jgi:hypothetical protein